MRASSLMAIAAVVAVAVGLMAPQPAAASRWEVRKEMREGAKSVQREKREAARELRKCQTRECARREVREGYREARREIRREVREDYYDRYYRGEGRWYRDGRYWDRYDYERRYYRRRDNDGEQFLKGALVGAAVVGVAAAVANSDDD